MWIMTTRKHADGLVVYIGSVVVARIGWHGSLMLFDRFEGDYKTVSLALKELHRRLKEPAPD